MNRRIRVELGRAWLSADQAGRFGPGSEIALDVPGSDLAEIRVEGRRIARGELAVLDGNYCVRVRELLDSQAPAERGPAGEDDEADRNRAGP